jgi:hypothetical protein
MLQKYALTVLGALTVIVLSSFGSAFFLMRTSSALADQRAERFSKDMTSMAENLKALSHTVSLNTSALGGLDGTLKVLGVQVALSKESYDKVFGLLTGRADKIETAFAKFQESVGLRITATEVSIGQLQEKQAALAEAVRELKAEK